MFAEFFPRRLFPSRNLRPSFFAFFLSFPFELPPSLRDQNPFSLFFVRAYALAETRTANVRAFPSLLTAHIPPRRAGHLPANLHEKYSTIFKLVPERIQTCAHVDISENRTSVDCKSAPNAVINAYGIRTLGTPSQCDLSSLRNRSRNVR